MPGYISKMATKTTKEKCRYGERFLYFSHCCDACLLNSALDEQANYFSTNSLICLNFLVDLQEISGGSWSLFSDDAGESDGRGIYSRFDVQSLAFLK